MASLGLWVGAGQAQLTYADGGVQEGVISWWRDCPQLRWPKALLLHLSLGVPVAVCLLGCLLCLGLAPPLFTGEWLIVGMAPV